MKLAKLFLALVLIFAFTACDSKSQNNENINNIDKSKVPVPPNG